MTYMTAVAAEGIAAKQLTHFQAVDTSGKRTKNICSLLENIPGCKNWDNRKYYFKK
jgi:hypothetical protein